MHRYENGGGLDPSANGAETEQRREVLSGRRCKFCSTAGRLTSSAPARR